jgi:metal-sulfur cluster biosynthetic enzyme
MSFDDLPDDWPHRSVADPTLAADLVDLVVSDADRREGALGLLLCRPDGTLAQPVIVTTQGCPDVAHLLDLVVDQLPHVPGVSGLVLAIARAWGGVTDADRHLHQVALEVCRAHELTLWGTFLATSGGVTPLPVARELAPHLDGPDTAA